MARWKLMQKHYLKVPDCSYEYRETTNSGRQIKKSFAVPQFLDPEYPYDCNYPREMREQDRYECIVAHAGPGAKEHDYIFEGPPTPDMQPLDDEAKAISAKYAEAWGRSGVEVEGDEGYSGRLLLELTETLQSFNASSRPSTPAGPDPRDEQIAKLMEMNSSLMEVVKANLPAGRRA